MSTRRDQRPNLREYIVIGLLTAVGFCILAVVGLSVGALVTSVDDVDFPPIPELALALIFIFISYFAAGIVGAVALWLLYPIKESFLGCVLRGAVLAPIIYCIVGFASVLLYVHADINMMDYDSPEDAWRFLRWSFPLFGVVGAIIWGPMLYFGVHRRT